MIACSAPLRENSGSLCLRDLIIDYVQWTQNNNTIKKMRVKVRHERGDYD